MAVSIGRVTEPRQRRRGSTRDAVGRRLEASRGRPAPGRIEMVAMTHFGFLSTYPPTRCGLATFTEALASSLVEVGEHEPTIVRVLDVRESTPVPAVFGRVPTTTELLSGNRVSMRASVHALETCDVAIVQHEFGIYGGSDGDEIIPLLRSLSTPAIVVLHTVLIEPTPTSGTSS